MKPGLAKIESPCKGVATYYTANGAWVFHAAIEADPLKDEKWIDMVAAMFPGGRQSVDFLQEFRADDDAKSGERLYWAFSRERNIIPRFPIPTDWPVYLGADFGQTNPTAITFNAQDPKTKQIYVFDSIYRPRGIDNQVKLLVYEKLAKHFGVSLKTLAIEGAYRYIERAVADPTAAPYIAFYAMEPWPIGFVINPGAKESNKHKSGESKVNKALWPSMVCCDSRQYPPGATDPPDELPCALCGKTQALCPVLLIFEDAAPELCQEYDDLIYKQPQFEGLETPEQAVKAPNHASDGERYLLFDLEWELEGGPSEREVESMRIQKLRDKPTGDRSFADKIELMMAAVAERQQRDQHFLEHRGKLTASVYNQGRIRYRSVN